ncbi:MAG: hypothetical protein HC786_04925 [Richelia sp. CSU_2_1]|nr:hypothetical protein [Richelia sp. CSU_2_1]
MLQPIEAKAQQPSGTENRLQVEPADDPTDPSNVRSLTQESILLSIQSGQRLMAEASNAISSQNYAAASGKLQESRQIFNQLSNFYQQLASSFSGIDPRLSDANRTKALETAQLRDEATYQLALVHRAQNKPELAVPLLIQIIRSQQPTRDLGKKAFQQLVELGFVDAPDSQQADSPSPTPNPTEMSLLSIPGGQRLMAEASDAISNQNYALASQKLQESRQVYNQLSNFYQQLANTFSGIDPKVSDTNRTKALETAQLRDEATYRLALVHRAQNKPELALPLLVQIIRSQQPTRDLGKKAYQQLLELGFVDVPYPRQGGSRSPTSSNK